MEDLGDVIERKRLRKQAGLFAGTLLLGAYLAGGAIQGIHEYREHAGDTVQAERHARETLCPDAHPTRLGRAIFYASWPGRQIGYWIAQHK